MSLRGFSVPGGSNSLQCAKGNVNYHKWKNKFWTEADGRYSVTMLAKAEHADFAGTGFGKFFGEAYAGKKVKNEVQPNLQKG